MLRQRAYCFLSPRMSGSHEDVGGLKILICVKLSGSTENTCHERSWRFESTHRLMNLQMRKSSTLWRQQTPWVKTCWNSSVRQHRKKTQLPHEVHRKGWPQHRRQLDPRLQQYWLNRTHSGSRDSCRRQNQYSQNNENSHAKQHKQSSAKWKQCSLEIE